MLGDVARGLAGHGIASVLTDPYGTGDSEGEFREADWTTWKDDLQRSAHWVESEGWPVSALLCVRLGCLLGADAAASLPRGVQRTVFWQPVIEGGRYLEQFLRLRIAAGMASPGERESVARLRDMLARGQTVEVAGYELSGQLAQGMSRLSLPALVGSQLGELHWIEIMRNADDAIGAASAGGIAAVRAKGVALTVHRITGEQFWLATELVSGAALVESSVRILAR